MGNAASSDGIALCVAVRDNNLAKVRAAVGANFKLVKNAIEPEGGTVWHVAASEGSVDVMEILREAVVAQDTKGSKGKSNPDVAVRKAVDMGDELGQSPLMRACLAGHEQVVAWLLAKGADPWRKTNFTNGEQSALHGCMRSGSKRCTEALLSFVKTNDRLHTRGGIRYADVRSLAGFSPLHYAAWHDRTGLISMLSRFGANMASKSVKKGAYEVLDVAQGSTALHVAARLGRASFIKQLLMVHAARNPLRTAAMDLRVVRDNNLYLPCWLAMQHHHYHIVAWLHPSTPLHEVADRSDPFSRVLGPPRLVQIVGPVAQKLLLAMIDALDPELAASTKRPHSRPAISPKASATLPNASATAARCPAECDRSGSIRGLQRLMSRRITDSSGAGSRGDGGSSSSSGGAGGGLARQQSCKEALVRLATGATASSGVMACALGMARLERMTSRPLCMADLPASHPATLAAAAPGSTSTAAAAAVAPQQQQQQDASRASLSKPVDLALLPSFSRLGTLPSPTGGRHGGSDSLSAAIAQVLIEEELEEEEELQAAEGGGGGTGGGGPTSLTSPVRGSMPVARLPVGDDQATEPPPFPHSMFRLEGSLARHARTLPHTYQHSHSMPSVAPSSGSPTATGATSGAAAAAPSACNGVSPTSALSQPPRRLAALPRTSSTGILLLERGASSAIEPLRGPAGGAVVAGWTAMSPRSDGPSRMHDKPRASFELTGALLPTDAPLHLTIEPVAAAGAAASSTTLSGALTAAFLDEACVQLPAAGHYEASVQRTFSSLKDMSMKMLDGIDGADGGRTSAGSSHRPSNAASTAATSGPLSPPPPLPPQSLLLSSPASNRDTLLLEERDQEAVAALSVLTAAVSEMLSGPQQASAALQEDLDHVCSVCMDDEPCFLAIQPCSHLMCVRCCREVVKLHKHKACLCPFCRRVVLGFKNGPR